MVRDADLTAGLIKAYWMDIETVQNYIANSVNLEGVRAEEIKSSLVGEEGHRRQFDGFLKEYEK
jgi:bacterioferritin